MPITYSLNYEYSPTNAKRSNYDKQKYQKDKD